MHFYEFTLYMTYAMFLKMAIWIVTKFIFVKICKTIKGEFVENPRSYDFRDFPFRDFKMQFWLEKPQ